MGITMNGSAKQTRLACGLTAAWERLLETSENPFERTPAGGEAGAGTAPAPEVAATPAEFAEFWPDVCEQIRRAMEVTRRFAESACESARDARGFAEKNRLATEKATAAADEARHSANAAHAAASELEWLIEEVRRTEDRLRSGRPSGPACR
jgi:hypothetical protein